MEWQATPFAIAALVTGGVAAWLAQVAWRHRHTPGAGPFALAMGSIALWTVTYGFELVSPNVSTKLFCTQVEYVGIVAAPLGWFIFAAEYTGRRLTRYQQGLLSIVPLGVLALVWTNPLHHLFFAQAALDTSGFISALAITHGPAFLVHVIYAYGLLLVAAFYLVVAYLRSPELFRGQLGALLIAVLAPWAGNVLYLLGPAPLRLVDPTPFAFAISGLALSWGVFRFQLFDIAPAAREMVVEELDEGVVVVDEAGRVVDINPKAKVLLGLPDQRVIGQPLAHFVSAWPDLMKRYHSVSETHDEFSVGGRVFDMQISPLRDGRGRQAGRVLRFSDITRHKQAEAQIAAAQTSWKC